MQVDGLILDVFSDLAENHKGCDGEGKARCLLRPLSPPSSSRAASVLSYPGNMGRSYWAVFLTPDIFDTDAVNVQKREVGGDEVFRKGRKRRLQFLFYRGIQTSWRGRFSTETSPSS